MLLLLAVFAVLLVVFLPLAIKREAESRQIEREVAATDGLVAENIRREARRASSPVVAAESDAPENPRFATWEEAMNRPVVDTLLFRIEYVDRDGVVTDREIEPTMIHLIPGRPEVNIGAFCHLRQAPRVFFSGRILKCANLKTGRPIKDLGQYLRGKY